MLCCCVFAVSDSEGLDIDLGHTKEEEEQAPPAEVPNGKDPETFEEYKAAHDGPAGDAAAQSGDAPPPPPPPPPPPAPTAAGQATDPAAPADTAPEKPEASMPAEESRAAEAGVAEEGKTEEESMEVTAPPPPSVDIQPAKIEDITAIFSKPTSIPGMGGLDELPPTEQQEEAPQEQPPAGDGEAEAAGEEQPPAAEAPEQDNNGVAENSVAAENSVEEAAKEEEEVSEVSGRHGTSWVSRGQGGHHGYPGARVVNQQRTQWRRQLRRRRRSVRWVVDMVHHGYPGAREDIMGIQGPGR